MIASAAHTSKGLAKAFVSSAGGKRPEYPRSPAPLSCAQRGARAGGGGGGDAAGVASITSPYNPRTSPPASRRRENLGEL